MADLDQSGPWFPALTDSRLDDVTTVLQQVRDDAQTIDRDGVSPADVDVLRDAGYFALTCPESSAQQDARALAREAVERCAAASGALWFVTTQHRSPLEAVRATSNEVLQQRFRTGLEDGSLLGAVAFAHIRRGGPPSVTAQRRNGGWRIDGRLDWLTSWGLADVLLLLAQTPDDRIVSLVLPAQERPGLVVEGPVELAAMAATSTVRVRITDMDVADDDVASLVSRDDWLQADSVRSSNVSSAVFGLLAAIVNDLFALGERRDLPAAREAAESFAVRGMAMRAAAYQLIDDAPADHELDERLRLRAAATQLAVHAAAARVAAEGGAAMTLASPAQRWAREALFYLVQAQTSALKIATVQGFAGGCNP